MEGSHQIRRSRCDELYRYVLNTRLLHFRERETKIASPLFFFARISAAAKPQNDQLVLHSYKALNFLDIQVDLVKLFITASVGLSLA